LSITNYRAVVNQFCGANGCTKTGITKIVFAIGFSAFFCKECASMLISEGLGSEDTSAENKKKALGSVVEAQAHSKPVKSTSPSSREIDQR
jgi:hypothetical protein